MISKSIINAVLNASIEENKDKVLNEIFNHVSISHDYNNTKASHILEMLVDSNSIITCEDVNINYINRHLELLIYKHEKYDIRNIKVDSVDNIDCNIKVTYEYLEKINEDRGDVSYVSSYSNINFIDNPDILKN